MTMAKIDISQLETTYATFMREVDVTMAVVADQLRAGRYVEAAQGMNILTERMAKTSVALRAILIKGGYIKEES
jgi:hypothetical protein